jgi:glycerophosphoryl diester phosphodiesterase
MSPAVQDSFITVPTGQGGCKQFSPSELPNSTACGARGLPGEDVTRTMPPPAVQAHRGSPDPASGVAENTLAAFARARRLGAQGVELDVRMTADGALAVHHDPQVAGGAPIHELDTGSLPPSVPLLADALEACEGLVGNIAIKNLPNEPGFDPTERSARDVSALVVEIGRSPTTVISSFWPGALDAVREEEPDLTTGLLIAPWFEPALTVEAAIAHGSRALHLPLSLVEEELVATAHRAGLAVAAWTVDAADDLLAVRDAGVDTVITNDVGLALTLYGTG